MLAVLKDGDGRGGGRCQDTASSLSQLSIQTVFSMLSHLMQWSRHILYSKPKNNGWRTRQKHTFSILVHILSIIQRDLKTILKMFISPWFNHLCCISQQQQNSYLDETMGNIYTLVSA